MNLPQISQNSQVQLLCEHVAWVSGGVCGWMSKVHCCKVPLRLLSIRVNYSLHDMSAHSIPISRTLEWALSSEDRRDTNNGTSYGQEVRHGSVTKYSIHIFLHSFYSHFLDGGLWLCYNNILTACCPTEDMNKKYNASLLLQRHIKMTTLKMTSLLQFWLKSAVVDQMCYKVFHNFLIKPEGTLQVISINC